ncbi:hypothetical protein FOA52_008837 [Chlamydomonas sp. UWO 241]|nr:hypothetical protein FOA52_008837 [Chlamydomonas sp. UWO 241]
MKHISADFQESTGYKVILDLVDPLDIARELIFTEQTSPLAYDGWFVDGSAAVDLVTKTKLVAPIDSFIARDSHIQWSDVTEYVREISSTYAGVTIGVPIGGKPLSLIYRRDVFAAANISAPKTWDDLVLAAQILNSTDFNADGTTDFALCWKLAECPLNGMIAVSAILATMTHANGPHTGFLWDPETMASLAGTAAMTRTMELIQELLPYSNTSCEVLNPNFMQGSCAVTIASDSLFKGASMNTGMKGVIGTAMVPGSTRVLNRQTDLLEECTPALCPHAKRERTYDGKEVLVNRAPHFGVGGFSGFVNALQAGSHQQVMYAFWSFMSEPMYSKKLVMTSLSIGPYRKSHLDASAQSLAAWTDLGYDEVDTHDFLTTVDSSLEHANFVPDLRMLGGQSYLDTLYTALRNVSTGMAPAQITANVLAKYTAILASSGPLDLVQQSLKAGLGILVASPPPTPPSPNQELVTQAASSNKRLAIILGVAIPLIVVLSALLATMFIVRHRKRSLFGGLLVPPPGEGTTLVVTDIMDSTPLWETLAPGVMECALATHNAVVRQTLVKWSGYEQATEGDSFLLAFHTPSDALGFAMQLQTSLLEAAWESELLQHPLCAPLAMGPSAALQETGGSDGRFALLRAAQLLPRGDEPSFNRPTSSAPGPSYSGNSARSASWDDMRPSLVAPDSHSTLAAAGSAISYMRARNGVYQSVTHTTFPVIDEHGLHGHSHSNQYTRKDVRDKPPSVCELSKARELLQSMHAAATDVKRSSRMDSSVPLSAAPVACTMAEFMQLAWTSEGSPAAVAVANSRVMVFKGLRVRIGMHSGVQKVDVERSVTSGRVYFGGMPLALTKAVGDAGAGGMVLMTIETFERLHPERALKGILVLAMGEHGLKDDLGPVRMFQAIERSLVPRLAVFEPLRGLSETKTGVMDAPIGTVAIAFANMVGLATLQAWDKDRADVVLNAYTAVLKQLLHDAGGYLVDLSSAGLCLAAFRHPLDAVAWGAGLIEVMKHRQWDEELLSHELCEEVLLQDPASRGGLLHSRVLFRGPRIKIGIDVGKVQADVAPLTGRMSYQGKVMNRAARISGKASSGMQWCSATAWEQANERFGARLLAAGIRGTQLGAFSLKGVIGDVVLVECSWRHGDNAADGKLTPASQRSLPLSRAAPMGVASQHTDKFPAFLRELAHSQPAYLTTSMTAGAGGSLRPPFAVSEARLSGALGQQRSGGSSERDSHPAEDDGPVLPPPPQLDSAAAQPAPLPGGGGAAGEPRWVGFAHGPGVVGKLTCKLAVALQLRAVVDERRVRRAATVEAALALDHGPHGGPRATDAQVFAGLRGLEAAVPTLWRMPLLNARKEPIWRLWPPARSVAVERAGELATMDLWDALASFAEGGGMPRGWAGVVGPTHPFVGVVDGGLTLNKTS